jgi:hypothetical protein
LNVVPLAGADFQPARQQPRFAQPERLPPTWFTFHGFELRGKSSVRDALRLDAGLLGRGLLF